MHIKAFQHRNHKIPLHTVSYSRFEIKKCELIQWYPVFFSIDQSFSTLDGWLRNSGRWRCLILKLPRLRNSASGEKWKLGTGISIHFSDCCFNIVVVQDMHFLSHSCSRLLTHHFVLKWPLRFLVCCVWGCREEENKRWKKEECHCEEVKLKAAASRVFSIQLDVCHSGTGVFLCNVQELHRPSWWCC